MITVSWPSHVVASILNVRPCKSHHTSINPMYVYLSEFCLCTSILQMYVVSSDLCPTSSGMIQ